MRVLVLGGAGMLGHKLWQAYRDRFDTWITLRANYRDYADYHLFNPARTISGVDAFDFDTIVRTFAAVQPTTVINCIGIIKQLPMAKDPIASLTVNALFPHRLSNLCAVARARLIHISSDCVFSGHKGMYTDEDVSDAEDLYGRTKFLGELVTSSALTLRTSIIGRELSTASGLVEWFLSNRGGKVRGYTNAIYTGFTTLALAEIIAQIIERFPTLEGLYQVASSPINKYDLLCMIRDAMQLEIEIEPYAQVQIDRSLDPSRFVAATGLRLPDWQEMIAGLATDSTPYDDWHIVKRN